MRTMTSRQSKLTQPTATIREKLLQALACVDRPGAFCAAADQAIVLPGLEVEQVGMVGLPMTKAQAKELIKVCQQAPYGKGTETVVDTKVRKVWELDPHQFKLTNKKWDALVKSIVANVQKSLGLSQQKLSPKLYKLLVYEKGGFFLPHRDGEKLDEMVATLVVALPSVHTGGELVVSHGGQTQKINMTGAATGCELSYAAFYADCQHEVRPLKSGYR